MDRIDGDVEKRRDLCPCMALEIVKDDDCAAIVVERIHRPSQQLALCRERVL
jgi:hypothetical protein